jgi:hypothetical protein
VGIGRSLLSELWQAASVGERGTFRLHVHAALRRPGNVFFPNWLAITIGRQIWTWRPLVGPELAHELKHAEQWGRLGWRYPFSYWASSLRAIRAGGDWYRDNDFEREARAAAAAAAAAGDPAAAGGSAGVAVKQP